MKTCPFCKQTVKEFHRRSHLMPEWMYTDIYDEKHKVLQVSRQKDRVIRRQRGLYGSFMCVDCEKESQKYDHYASLILTRRSIESNEYKAILKEHNTKYYKSDVLKFSRWNNIDFDRFQKFILSIVLRYHFSGLMKDPITLTDKHADRILALYKEPLNLDDISYPILLAEYSQDDPFINHVILPYFEKKHGHHMLEFSGCGYLFNVYVSSHEKPRYVKSLRLKNDGSMYVIGIGFRETGLYRNSAKLVKELKNISKSI